MNGPRAAATALAVAAAAVVSALLFLRADLSRVLSPSERSHLPATFSRSHAHAVVMQQTISDCGPAAVATLDNLHGKHDTLADLDNELQTSLTGTTIASMEHVLARRFERPVRAIVKKLRDLKSRTPIIVWHEGHFLVLYSVTAQSVELLDPWFGDIVTTSPSVRNWTIFAFT